MTTVRRGLMVSPEVSRTRTRQASSWAVSPVTHTETKLIKRTSLHGSQLVGSVAMLNNITMGARGPRDGPIA